MAGGHNVLVRGYHDVDLAIVIDLVQHRLDGLLALVRALRPLATAEEPWPETET
jgi:uncharacterized protein YutE (UPF0331/DUF86 family)